MLENIEIIPKIEINSKEVLALVYTPSVAKSSLEIKDNLDRVFDLTNRSNSIAVISFDYKNSLRRAIYLKREYSLDAYPLEVKECMQDELEFVIENIMPNFMGVDKVLIEGGEYSAPCDIPTQSKNCFIQKPKELEAVKLREVFGGVIETKIYIQNEDKIRKPVAVLSDGSAVLGLGNIGAEAGLPVMEGKAALFKSLANVDAMPLCVRTQNPDEIVKIAYLLENSFAGINLEDICAPRCFEIEEKMIEKLGIPVFHDDQHGTAIIVSAGILNALKLLNKKLENVKIVMSGAGAAGCAICKQLLRLGARNITMFDINGVVYAGRAQNDPYLEQLAKKTNLENKICSMEEALSGADIFIGVSKGGILKAEWVSNMAENPVIFALANPTPEIMPDVALTSGAKIVATGRSDFPNQINNSLVFPGLFRGVIDSGLQKITDDIKILASISVASMVDEADLNTEYIIPEALDKDVAKNISACIIEYVRNPNTHTY